MQKPGNPALIGLFSEFVEKRLQAARETRSNVLTFADHMMIAAAESLTTGVTDPRLAEFGDLETLCAALLLSANAPRYLTQAERHEFLAAMPTALALPTTTNTLSQGMVDSLFWRGKPLVKSLFDYALYPMLIQAQRPATIIEIGSGTGASALWLRDICSMEGMSTQILSVDLTAITDTPEGVTYIQGDCNHIEAALPDALLRTLPHPWIVSEDAHVNVYGVLKHLAGYLEVGDYIFVEDNGAAKAPQVDRFLDDVASAKIDRYYVDFFGINATTAKNSVLAIV